MKRLLLIVCGLSLVGCAPQRAEPAPNASRVELSPQAPASAARIESLLRAFHAQDLPDAQTFAAYEDAEASLIYLSEHADLLMVRARALSSLRWFATPAAHACLMRTLERDAHPKLLAAALRGCQPNACEAAAALLAHPDPRVRRAAQTQVSDPSVGPGETTAPR